MPSPKKEIIIDNISIKGLCSIAVGGVFDIESGFIKRAPQWMQKLGLEWFFRLTKEPRKMYKRYLITNTMFIIYSIKELIKRSKYYDFKK
jgi:N-acetylglucosaminyldiphosphoundecaprenol N-acetyl-beta-D-mannosaminyltransferase